MFAHLYSGESTWPLGPTPGRDNPFLQRVMPQLFRLNDDRELALLVLAGLAGLLLARRFRAATFAVASLAIGLAAPLFKSFFDRGSPFPLPGQTAFPSGHGLGTMAIAATIVVLAWGTRWRRPAVAAAAVLVVVIGSTVIADGGHWPSDVVGGWCLAIAWVSALSLAAARMTPGPVGVNLRVRGLRRTRVAPDRGAA